MANQKISELTAIATIDNATDVLPIVDTSATTTKKITLTQVKSSLALDNVNNTSDANKPVSSATQTALDAKQATLVSATNIKTINSTSILGSGNIVVGATPSGIAGAIQFSDGSAFASDATNLFWDDTNNRLGIGTNAPSGTAHFKGSGSTSATTSLLMQNSAGANSLQVTDDGSVFNLGKNAVSTNTAFGKSALIANTTGSGITAIGVEAALTNTSGTGITAIGYQALTLSTGINNTALGFQSLDANTTGASNTAVGASSLGSNTTGSNNVCIGLNSLAGNTTGNNNTALGRSALANNNADNNVAVGREAGLTNTTGTGITAIGYQALRDSTGNENTAVGFQALVANTTGTVNTAVGANALNTNTTGGANIAIGTSCLSTNTTGSHNTAIGRSANSGNFDASVILGREATATASNQFVVGSAAYNAGTITTEVVVSDRTWSVRINGTAYKILLKA